MRETLLTILFITLTGLAAAGATAAPSSPAAPAGDDECQGTNLLANPSFEGQYSAYVPPDGHPDCPAGICGTAQMAPDWIPWWRSHDPADPPWIIRMPEFKPADPAFTDPVRVRSGGAAQQYFSFHSTHEAGVLQRVAVTPGAEYCFSVWGHAWSAHDSDDAYSGPDDGLLNQRIGIDPTGGTDWQSADIIWGAERLQYDFYGLFKLTAVAQADHITVFTHSEPLFAKKHNDVYWDDARLTAVGEMNPAPELTFLADVDEPGVQSRLLPINLTGLPTTTWTAVLDSGDPIAAHLSLSPTSGGPGEDLTVTLDSAGLATGVFTTTVTIEVTPAVPGSPADVPVTVVVAPEISHSYLPGLQRP